MSLADGDFGYHELPHSSIDPTYYIGVVVVSCIISGSWEPAHMHAFAFWYRVHIFSSVWDERTLNIELTERPEKYMRS